MKTTRTITPRFLPVLVLLLVLLVAAGCGGDGRGDDDASGTTSTTESSGGDGGEQLSGRVEADGSSTVGPFTSAAAERFGDEQPDVQVTVGVSGTGGGFERFCRGETDLSNASR
ncbi:MAG: substrate-binding domain-containing protein, partial [Actinobacteria bacterium]|nr:substrate-binding domain-containing protein [Actinomycetota bacterium]